MTKMDEIKINQMNLINIMLFLINHNSKEINLIIKQMNLIILNNI